MKVGMAAAAAVCAALGVAAADEETDGSAGAEPEKIDVVYERLGVQKRTLETVVEIVAQLEAVAEQSEAAQALLSDEGDPTERLKRALDEVVGGRLGRVGEGAVAAPIVVEAEPAVEPEANEEGRRDVAVEVVYAQRADGGPGRVVVAVRGSHYAATVGQRVLVGEDVVEVLRIAADPGGGLSVELKVNGGAPIVRRVRS